MATIPHSKTKNTTDLTSKKIPNIKWNHDGGALTWKFISQLDRDENWHIFCGKAEKMDVCEFLTYYSFIIVTFILRTQGQIHMQKSASTLLK